MKIKAIAYFLAIAFIISAAYVLALSPEVTLTFPDEGYNSTSSEINLSANISGDNVSNVTLYGNWTGAWEANQTNESQINESEYTFTVNLNDGTYAWNVYACDNESNCTFAENRTFTIDTTPPHISGVSNASTSNDSTLITWTTNEDANSTIYVGTNESLLNQGSNYSETLTQSHELGIYNLINNTLYYYNVTSCDYHGLCNTTGPYNFTTTSNPNPAIIESIILSDYVVQNITEVVVTVNITNGTYPLSNVSANNELLSHNLGVWNGTINLTDSVNYVTIIVIDEYPITVTGYSDNYTIDDDAPLITTSFINNTNTSNENITFSYNITDANIILNSTYTYNSSPVEINETGSLEIQVSEGAGQNITITSEDEAGNIGTEVVFFSIDRTPPEINAIEINKTYPYVRTGTMLNVTVNASDSTTGISSVSLNGQTMNQDGEIWHLVINITGTQNFSVLAMDYANNNATNTTFQVTTDDTNPYVNITSPLNDEIFYTNNITANWTITDDNFKNVSYKLDTNDYADSAENFTYIENLNAGFHTLIVRAYDLADNVGYAYVNFTAITFANISETITALTSENPLTHSYNVSNSETGEEYTQNESVNLTGIYLDLEFYINQASGSDTLVRIVNFSGYNASWSRKFSATNNNNELNESIISWGTTPFFIVSISGIENFLTSTEFYYGTATFNVTDMNWTSIHHCTAEDYSSCTTISQCENNLYTDESQLDCYTNTSDELTAHVNHFSSIVVSFDDVVGETTISSPNNSANLTSGTNVYFNFTVNEQVTGNFTFDDNYTQSIGTGTSFSFKLNGTLNRTQLGTGIIENGEHNITLIIKDGNNNSDTIIHYFNVSDYEGPVISNIAITGTSTTSSSGTAVITATSNEYSYCWISTSISINDSAWNKTSFTVMAGGLALSHTHSISYSSNQTLGPYYIRCSDALNNDMAQANSTGSFSVTKTTTSSDTGTSTTTSEGGTTTYSYALDENPSENTPTPVTTPPATPQETITTHSISSEPSGATLIENENLKDTIKSILSLENMSNETLTELLNSSEQLMNEVQITRDFESRTDRTKITTSIAYEGTQTLTYLLVYEIVPKEFAESDAQMVVTSSNGVIELVRDDPEYLVRFSNVKPGDLVTITYETNSERQTSVLEDFSTELYSIAETKQAPEKKPSKAWIIWILIIIIIIGAIFFISRRGKNHGERPQRQHETWANKIMEKIRPGKKEGNIYDHLRDKYLKK